MTKCVLSWRKWRIHTSSSSSLSSFMVRLGVISDGRGEGSRGTLNFSAAALCTCCERSSILQREERRPEAQINEHRSRYKYLNIHFARNSVGICSQLFIALFVCFLWEKTNLGLSKDYVNIWGRAFEHIWTCNNKENVLGLPNSDACHSVNLFQPKLWHRLVITTTWRKREYVRDFVHNTVSFKVAWNVLVDVQSHLSCFFLTSTLLGSADRLIGRRVW